MTQRRDGQALSAVVAAMDRLRSPGGCPWDAEQTHRSLAPYAIEEAYELAEAAEADDRDALRGELGDLLLQVVFHARVAEEHTEDPFSLDDVAQVLLDKLVRRHPHVFADAADVRTAADVEDAWHEIKKRERVGEDVLAGIPLALPALARAQKVARRLRREGLDGDALLAVADEDSEALVGRELMRLVLRAEAAGVDAEAALRGHVRTLAGRREGPT
ncbi:MazG family protein [Georgenia sp. H159]|uniref:MazG family protein n=1 Tax=Georgenia sp. H159 TaxID=3076115 RepID=UPI002D79D6F1|nr:MazG family protein [Georgenia sp. H159]